MAYAEQTKVLISRIKTEIEELLAKHGAIGFGYGTGGDRAMVAFETSGLLVLVMVSVQNYAGASNHLPHSL